MKHGLKLAIVTPRDSDDVGLVYTFIISFCLYAYQCIHNEERAKVGCGLKHDKVQKARSDMIPGAVGFQELISGKLCFVFGFSSPAIFTEEPSGAALSRTSPDDFDFDQCCQARSLFRQTVPVGTGACTPLITSKFLAKLTYCICNEKWVC